MKDDLAISGAELQRPAAGPCLLRRREGGGGPGVGLLPVVRIGKVFSWGVVLWRRLRCVGIIYLCSFSIPASL
jgi:hypothetical protein